MNYLKFNFITFSITILLFSLTFVKSEAPQVFNADVDELSSRCESLSINEEVQLKLLSEELVLMEIDFFILGLKDLLVSQFWLDCHNMENRKELIKPIIDSWIKIENDDPIHNHKVVKYFNNNFTLLKREVLQEFSHNPENKPTMVTKFVNVISRLNCYRMKTALAIIYLSFYYSDDYFTSGFLFFLLICSFRELSFTSFSLGFSKVMRNEEQMGSKLIVLGGSLISSLISAIQRVSYQYYNVDYPISQENQQMKNPINLDLVIIEEFGLRFCISLLELAAAPVEIKSQNYLLFFFGSRMELAAEVLLSIDILKELLRFGKYISESLSLLLNDHNVFLSLKAKINSLHGLDIARLKLKFNECILIKEKYPLLNGIKYTTDFLLRARRRSKSRKKKFVVNLRSKYPFL